MFIMTVIDGSIKRNRKFGFELQSSHVIEKRNEVYDFGLVVGFYEVPEYLALNMLNFEN